MRMSYQRQKEVLEMPNLIEVQKDSYTLPNYFPASYKYNT